MRSLVGLSGLIFFLLAVISALGSYGGSYISYIESALYAAGIVLVLLSSKSRSAVVIKLLASSSAILMFAYFFLLFIGISPLGESSIGIAGVFLPMIAAFAIMPLVAQLTCRMKAGGCKAYFESQKRTISV